MLAPPRAAPQPHSGRHIGWGFSGGAYGLGGIGLLAPPWRSEVRGPSHALSPTWQVRPDVSVGGLGCNNFGGSAVAVPGGTTYGLLDLEQTRAVVDAAFDAGINFFDTADVYGKGGSETFLGEILKDRRNEVVIGTKWSSGLEARPEIAWGSRRYIRQACEASLTRMKTDYIDLYQMHWPDRRTPWEETLAALDKLVIEGKVRYLGHSHLTGWEVATTDWIARTGRRERFISAQNHYSLLERGTEAELIPACAHYGVGLLPYFPLAKGLLTGEYRKGQPAQRRPYPQIIGRVPAPSTARTT